jgi:hypothetical protein
MEKNRDSTTPKRRGRSFHCSPFLGLCMAARRVRHVEGWRLESIVISRLSRPFCGPLRLPVRSFCGPNPREHPRTHVRSTSNPSILRGFAGHRFLMKIGAAGFEPATPCSQSRCATKLRHAPCHRVYSRLRTLPHARARPSSKPARRPSPPGGNADHRTGPRRVTTSFRASVASTPASARATRGHRR